MYLNILKTIKGNNHDETLPEKIDNEVKSLPLSESFVIVYHHYDSGFDGDYDISFANPSTIANGFNYRVDDRSLSQIASIGSGSSVTVADLWRQIRDLENDGVLKRHYYQDFELHHSDGGVDILLGLDEDQL